MALRRIAAAAACVRFEPGPLSPEHITSNFESRTPDNPKPKEFLETNRNRKFFNRPASPGEHLLGIFQADSGRSDIIIRRLDGPGAKHTIPDTK